MLKFCEWGFITKPWKYLSSLAILEMSSGVKTFISNLSKNNFAIFALPTAYSLMSVNMGIMYSLLESVKVNLIGLSFSSINVK